LYTSALQLRRHVSPSAADSNAADTAYQHDEVILDGNRPSGPQNPRSVGHARRLTDPGYGRTRPSRITEIEEDRVEDAPSQVHGNWNIPPGRMDASQRTGGVTRASSTRGSFESRRMHSPLGENFGRLGARSGQGSEIPASSYYTARSALGSEAESEQCVAGSSEMGTDIVSLPSYHTMPAPTRRTYRTT
jgi:hypothetical protein